MISQSSSLREHRWYFMPGCLAVLVDGGGNRIATIESKEIGYHLWREARAVYDRLHDAQRAVEKSAVGNK